MANKYTIASIDKHKAQRKVIIITQHDSEGEEIKNIEMDMCLPKEQEWDPVEDKMNYAFQHKVVMDPIGATFPGNRDMLFRKC